MTMHQKVNMLSFLIHAQKGQLWKKIKFDHSLVLFLLHLSSLLVKRVEDVAFKSSYNNFYQKNEHFNLYIFNVIYM